MKLTIMRGKKSKSYTILPGVLALAAVALLCMPQMIPAASAQNPSSGTGWHAAMAMGNLAERERRIEEQKAAKKNETEIVAVIPVTDKKEYGNSTNEKYTLEQ